MIVFPNIKIIIREDLAHFSPIGVDWYNGLKDAGYDTTLIPDRQSLFTLDTNIDVFINMMDITDPDVEYYVKKLKSDNPKIKILSTVAHPFEKQEAYFDYVDYWFDCGLSHPIYDKWFKSRSQKFISVLEAGNPKLFYKLNVDENAKRDFSFIGQFGNRGHGDRDEDKYLYPLMDDINLTNYTYGFAYKDKPAQYIKYSNLNQVFNFTKINLNFHYPAQKSEKTVINKRTFDIAVSGNFQLCDHIQYFDIFGFKSFNDGNSYIDAFYFYKDNPDERKWIAEQIQKVALEEHTWEVRMKQLIYEIYNM
jgi:spore maturation protein CgeB